MICSLIGPFRLQRCAPCHSKGPHKQVQAQNSISNYLLTLEIPGMGGREEKFSIILLFAKMHYLSFIGKSPHPEQKINDSNLTTLQSDQIVFRETDEQPTSSLLLPFKPTFKTGLCYWTGK